MVTGRSKEMIRLRGGNDAAHDQSAVRGFSTDQRIDIEKLNVQQRMLKDRRDETTIVALSIEESAIGRQLGVAEKRAEQRCPKYDATNVYWKQVDQLIEDQQSVMDRIRAFNTPVTTSIQNTKVSEFMNQDSPIKNKNVL